MINEVDNQALRERFNPDGSLLRRHQLRMLEMLKYIDSICKKHNIKYWLSSGTLLGAVRHGGFIPWDDDLDIEMLREDYDALVKVLENEKSDSYVLQTHESDFEYFAPYGKLRDLKSCIKEDNANDLYYKYQGVYIDIFIMEPSSSLFFNKVSSYIQWHLFYVPNKYFRNITFRKYYYRITYFLIYRLLFPMMKFVSFFGANNQLRHTLGSCFSTARYLKDIFPLSHLSFENVDFPVPCNYDEYLGKIYGEYMTLPNLDSIRCHTTEVILK